MKLQHYYNEILYFSFIIILPRTTYVFRVYLTVFEKRKYETNTTVKLAFKKLTYNQIVLVKGKFLYTCTRKYNMKHI